MRTYGKIELRDNAWHIQAEPHVLLKMKALFGKVSKYSPDGIVRLSCTPENATDLLWLLQRYPLEVSCLDLLQEGARVHHENIARCEELLGGSYTPRAFPLVKPARDYQARATEILLRKKRLFIGDDVGLGKSLVAIAAMTDPRALPALVVTLTALPKQWEGYLQEFVPGLTTHIIKKGTPYELPKFFGRSPDVLITNYHKLSGWAHVLAGRMKFVCFDEGQELRRRESDKYKAAKRIADAAEFCCATTATPIMNYGGEFWNVADVICPGALGEREEFEREWCSATYGGNMKIRDPRAFGTYLRESFLMLRRTRKEVGRELPPVIRIPHTIDSDSREMHKIKDSSGELARIILDRITSTREERWQAAGQFDMLMRQATGIAKAPYVADFVRMLVESGEQVILAGWHRTVYDIWHSRLKDLNPAWYTGSESPVQNDKSKEEFLSGRSKVILMSLRSAVGVEGFQKACHTVVVGELDWSPGVIDQLVGRVHRDGVDEPVVVYYLLAEDGADPIMADILGIKREQAEGIVNPESPLIERLEKGDGNIRKLAESFLGREGHAHASAQTL
jgi:SNF2 family DNA or RNA helicase